MSTAGFAADKDTRAEDFAQALFDKEGIGQSIYRTSSGERVMAMSAILPFACGEILSVRLVTSMALIDKTLFP